MNAFDGRGFTTAKSNINLRKAALGASAVGLVLFCAGSAFAQTAPASDTTSGASDESVVLENIVVTGTSIRGIKPVGSATVPLTREDIQRTGLTSTADVVRTLPQLQNLGIDETRTAGSQDAGTNSSRGTALNLRGLGANATLMLVDGRRIAPSGTISAFGDPNQIPIAALERIEVVTDGASAIYGTDAVGGVVNFILRKNFNGAEATARYSTTDGYHQAGFSGVIGKTWSRGNVIIAYDHDDRSSMTRGDSPFLRQDLRRFGGNDNRINGATVSAATPVVVVQNGPSIQYFSLPAGSSGTGLTGASLTPGANVVDTADYADYLPHRKRDSLTGFLNFDLTDSIKLYWQGFYNARDSRVRSYRVDTITVPSTNPYYIAGVPGVTPGAALTVRYPWLKDFGQKSIVATERSTSNTIGLTAKLPADWRLDVYGTHALAKNCQCEDGASAGIVNTTALRNLLTSNDPSFNPFSAAPISDAVRRRVLGENLQRNQTILGDVVAKVDGALFDLPGGAVRAAFGTEFVYLKGTYRNAGTTTRADNLFVATYSGDKVRKVYAGFAELYVPLVGSEMSVPLVQRLDLSLATRYEHYSDFGGTNNPKIGLTWSPTSDLTIRGTWGKSFRAPSLQENNEDVVTTFIATSVPNGSGDPAIPVTTPSTGTSNVLSRVLGGNDDLGPERAKTYSVGFDYAPHWAEGLRLSATYYNIRYRGKIVTLGDQASTFLATPANRKAYADYIVVAPQPSTCVEGDPSTYNPVYIPFVTAPYPIPFTGTPYCSLVAYLNGQAQNLGRVEQDGIDLQANYQRDTRIGALSSGIALTKILNLRQTLSPSSGLIDVLDTINNPVSTRIRGQLGWSRGPVSTTLFINRTGAYTNNVPITVAGVLKPISRVPSWTTFDVNLAFQAPDEGPKWSQGIRLSLSVQNLTDKDPPVVLSGANAFDNQQANPYGRIWSLELTKRF